MTMVYNPIVRVFCQLRAALADATGVPSRSVRPTTKLNTLLPRERRRELWQAIRRTGIRLPWLELPRPAHDLGCLMAIVPVVVSVYALGHWAGCFAAIPALLAFVLFTRQWATEFPAGIRTVGELTLCVINFAEHRASGYKWTTNEIAFKVRVELSEALNVPLDQIGLKSRLRSDLGAE